MPAVAIGIGLTAAAGASVLGADAQKKAAREAGRASQRATEQGIATTKEAYGDVYNALQPYAAVGQPAMEQLQGLSLQDYLSGQTATGDLQKYIDQLEGLDFQFDPNDPIYQWKLAENERVVNQFQASRGSYDSRAALNALQQGQFAVTNTEIDRQFNQRYLSKFNQLSTLAELSYNKAQSEYNAKTNEYSVDANKLLTLLNLGYGATSDIANAKQSEAAQINNLVMGNAENQQNALLQVGAAKAGLANSLGTLGGALGISYGSGNALDLSRLSTKGTTGQNIKIS